MKISRILTFAAFGFLTFIAPVNSFSQSIAKPQTACDVYAYVIDKDPNGLNVRRGAGKNFGALGKIAPDGDGVMLKIIGASGSWVMIEDAETVNGEKAFDGNGWVFASMLGTSTRMKSKLYSTPSLKAKSLATVPTETEVTIIGCSGDWAKVKYGSKQGWLAPENQCGNPVTTCP